MAARAAAVRTCRTIADGYRVLLYEDAKRRAAVKKVCNARSGLGRAKVVVYEGVGHGFQVVVLKRRADGVVYGAGAGAGAGFP